MWNWVKGFVFLAILVATPYVIELLLGRNPRFPGEREVGAWPWGNVLTYGAYGAACFAVLAAIVGAVIFYYKTDEISELLTLAEREMTALLRGWGGGLGKDTRKEWAEERGRWLQMIKDDKTDMAKTFFELNQKDLEGGAQATPGGRARLTAFLLRELYEGNVETAQAKVYNEAKNGNKPFIVAGLRQLIDFDDFNDATGFPPGSGVDPYLLWLAVKLHGHPRHIVMVKTDANKNKFEVRNWDVINELNRQSL
ncbi:MAG: hypothetical protein WAN43_02640 [Rhodomicrobium sp.]